MVSIVGQWKTELNDCTLSTLLISTLLSTSKPVEYDCEKGMINNHPDAANFVAPAPRKSWEVWHEDRSHEDDGATARRSRTACDGPNQIPRSGERGDLTLLIFLR
jgi:hypothetical protein